MSQQMKASTPYISFTTISTRIANFRKLWSWTAIPLCKSVKGLSINLLFFPYILPPKLQHFTLDQIVVKAEFDQACICLPF